MTEKPLDGYMAKCTNPSVDSRPSLQLPRSEHSLMASSAVSEARATFRRGNPEHVPSANLPVTRSQRTSLSKCSLDTYCILGPRILRGRVRHKSCSRSVNSSRDTETNHRTTEPQNTRVKERSQQVPAPWESQGYTRGSRKTGGSTYAVRDLPSSHPDSHQHPPSGVTSGASSPGPCSCCLGPDCLLKGLRCACRNRASFSSYSIASHLRARQGQDESPGTGLTTDHPLSPTTLGCLG